MTEVGDESQPDCLIGLNADLTLVLLVALAADIYERRPRKWCLGILSKSLLFGVHFMPLLTIFFFFSDPQAKYRSRRIMQNPSYLWYVI